MRRCVFLFAIALSACVEEPTPKEAGAAAELQAGITPQKQLEEQALSIEQAADAAVKLIEEEAKTEIDSLQTEPTPP